jgi:hypothetical protein
VLLCTSPQLQPVLCYVMIRYILLTAIGLSPGGSTHLHTNNTQNKTNNNRTTQIQTDVEECGPCPRLCEFYPGICPTTEGKSTGKTSVRLIKASARVQYTYYQKHPHITKPAQKHTLQNNIKPPQYVMLCYVMLQLYPVI